VLRRATPADADAVADVFLAARAGMTYLPRLHTEEDTRGWIRNVVLTQYEVWVAVHDGRVAAFAALGEDELAQLYVHSDVQGLALGSLLLDEAKRRRPHGFGFWVFQKNVGARRFYERHGCRVVELTDGSGNEEHEPDALYEWRP
jgi:GNAT superfamily N-acetyltransferase